jgi:hypothetical protein
MDATAARPIPNQQPITNAVNAGIAGNAGNGAWRLPCSRWLLKHFRFIRRRFERDPDLHLVRLADSRDSEIG